jgi:hypothetical protein
MTPMPDTTDAIEDSLLESDLQWHAMERGVLADVIARAVAADRKALAGGGFAIVKVGEVPPWMKEAEDVYIRLDRPDNPLIDGQYLLVSGVFAVIPEQQPEFPPDMTGVQTWQDE